MGGNLRNKKFFALASLLLVFGVLFSSYAFAATKASITSVRVNGNDIAENKENFIQDSNNLDIIVALSALVDLSGSHVQAILTDRITGSTVSDSSESFDLASGRNALAVLSLRLIDSLRRDKTFNLDIRVIGRDSGVLERKTFGVKFTGGRNGKGTLDISLNRVRINSQLLAPSQANFIDKNSNLAVSVEFTPLEDLKGAHVEAVLKDLNSGTVVADATSNFDLTADVSATSLLNLVLQNGQRNSGSFELTVKITDLDGNLIQQVYGIKTRQSSSSSSSSTGALSGLDISVNRVLVNNQAVASSQTNFVDRSNELDIVVEFTALENLNNAHVEAILRDLQSGDSVADATSTFNLNDGSSTSSSLKLNLLDRMKQSGSFELTINIIDQDGNTVRKIYGISMRDRNKAVNGVGRSLDVSIDRVELENKKVLAENENNFVILDSINDKMRLKVDLTALEKINNAHVEAVLQFENGNVVSDATRTFDISTGQNTIKNLEIPVIGKFQQANFRLKVKIVDPDGNAEEKSYGLIISQQKFPFVISTVSLAPEDNAEAGKNLFVKLGFKNSGVLPLDGVTVKVSIPELGISSTKFIENIGKSNLQEFSGEFVLKLLGNVQTGAYTVRSEVASQFGGDSEVKEIPVTIIGQNDQQAQIINDKLVISVPTVKQGINDGSEAIYPITLRNDGPSAKAYTILLDGAGWANLRLSESNTFILKQKESKTINVYASSNGNAKGEQAFVVAIKSEDNVLSQIPLKGNLTTRRSSFGITTAFGIILVGAVILLLLAGLVYIMRRHSDGGNGQISDIPDESEGEAYY